MRRFTTIALIGIAVATVATEAQAQGRGGRQRAGAMDTARMRRPDSVRQQRIDSLRAAGGLDSNRAVRMGRGGPIGRGPAMSPMGRGGAGLMGIQLNDNEKAAVKTITEKYREEYRQLRESNQGAGRERDGSLAIQMRALQEKEQAEIRAALTAEHQAQFDANIAKRKEMEAKAPSRRRPPRPPSR